MPSAALFAASAAALLAASGAAPAEDKKEAGPVTLTVVSKKDKYVFDGGGKSPKEYKEGLEALAKKLEKAGLGSGLPPEGVPVDLALVLTNTGKEAVTVFVGGDANEYTLELTGGAGVVTIKNPAAFTRELRRSRAVTIEPGKTHEVPVKVLADGLRGAGRFVYWTGPGEYKLTAKYTLAKNADGDKGPELTSEPVKIAVAEK